MNHAAPDLPIGLAQLNRKNTDLCFTQICVNDKDYYANKNCLCPGIELTH